MESPSSKHKQKHGYSQHVPAVQQATKILKYLSSAPGFEANLKDICVNAGIHNSKGYAILNTLQKAGFVKRDNNKVYSLGFGLISIGHQALDNVRFREIAKLFLEELVRETHCTSLFGLIASDQVVIVCREDSDHDVGVTLHPGHAFPLTYSATGKAIVAFLSEKEREKLLAEEYLFFHGEPANLDRERLAKELDKCRHVGYAEAPGKVSPLVRIIASPVLGRRGSPIGTIFIIGIFPKTLAPSYGSKVAETARKASSMLGSDATWPSHEAAERAAEVHLERQRKTVDGAPANARGNL
jgi:DNA-binding IclR family transcriptional regulator